MRWDVVIAKVAAAMAADGKLVDIYGTAIRMAGSGTHQVPLLEFSLIADSETELWAPCVVQFDQFTTEMTQLRASERRLRQLWHQDLPISLDGLGMWCQYNDDGTTLALPDRDGYYGRAVRFRFTPLRERYDSLMV